MVKGSISEFRQNLDLRIYPYRSTRSRPRFRGIWAENHDYQVTVLSLPSESAKSTKSVVTHPLVAKWDTLRCKVSEKVTKEVDISPAPPLPLCSQELL